MYSGTINCSCGAVFYAESVNSTITCPTCGKIHALSLKEVESEQEALNGADVRK